jgi:TetR/AcrR family transcriptional regulator, lmrAB and yxaGH operons repressor
MQNLVNERSALDAGLTERLARGFVDLCDIIAEHLRNCGFAPARASSSAAALLAAIEGARTIARVERTPAVFEALADIFCRRWPAPAGDRVRLST